MKVTLHESFPGELAALDGRAMRSKMRKAFTKLAEQQGLAGGEVDVIDDLADLLVDVYDERKTALNLELAQAVVDASE